VTTKKTKKKTSDAASKPAIAAYYHRAYTARQIAAAIFPDPKGPQTDDESRALYDARHRVREAFMRVTWGLPCLDAHELLRVASDLESIAAIARGLAAR
jgi:hypothetical protein